VAFSAVQRIAKGANAASISIGAGDGWATPTTGNLLVVSANSDATVTITGTWTAGPSVVDGNGTYIWYRISDGTESTVTCTPSVPDTIAITACEYSGNTATPFDVSNTSTIAGSAGTTTTAVSVTTTADADLVIATACTHTPGSTAPTSPSWTNSFVNQLTATSGGSLAIETVTFYAELIAGTAGVYSTSASWTNDASDRQELVIAFKAATATPDSPNPAPFYIVVPGRGLVRPGQFNRVPPAFSTDAVTTVTGTAALTGAGVLTSPATQAAPASPTGAGTLAATAVQQSGSTLTGAGTLTAPATQQAPATPTGVGVLTATGASGAIQGTAAIAGAGSLTTAATQQATTAVVGAGVLAAAATQRALATLTGVGTLTAAGFIAGSASLTGAGVLASPARLLAGAAAAGAGVLTCTAGGSTQGTATLAAVGVLAAVGTTCVTSRPNTGVTSRPGSGLTVRPDTGVTDEPC
jgi:hypothetical protein